MTPQPDRRQQPRIPGMIVTQPAPLDDGDSPLHILPYTREQLKSLITPQPLGERPPAGHITFVGTEPNDDETIKDTGWPATRREKAALWLIVAGCAALTVGSVLIITGRAAGLSLSDIVGIVASWGGLA